jgi:hypothetical protein
VRELGGVIEGAAAWEVDVAAVLSRLGCVAVPETVLAAAARGGALSPEEQRQADAVPSVARDLLRPIPRLERVTEILEHLNRPFRAAGGPHGASGKALPLGSRVLRAAFDFDTLVARGVPERQAVDLLRSRADGYDPEVLAALEALLHRQSEPQVRELWVGELVGGMVLAEDVYNGGGALLLGRGHPITEALKHRLEALAQGERTPKKFRVLVPPAARGLSDPPAGPPLG